MEEEQNLLTKRNTYRLKVIRELVEKSKEQDEQLKRVDKYTHEKKQYEKKVKNLKSEISNLNTKLGTNTEATKEREAAISDMTKKLKGVSRTKEIINVCLTEASISIRAALGNNKIINDIGTLKVGYYKLTYVKLFLIVFKFSSFRRGWR